MGAFEWGTRCPTRTVALLVFVANGCNVASSSHGHMHVNSSTSQKLSAADVAPENIWNVLTGQSSRLAESQMDTGDETGDQAAETQLDFNGVRHQYDGYSKIVEIVGYSSGALCAKVHRTEPVDGHKCDLDQDWFALWPPPSIPEPQCFIDNIRSRYNKDTKEVENAKGTDVWDSKCPPPTDEFHYTGDYDWRYGGLRPQDSTHSKLWPTVAKYIEDIVTKEGKPVVLYAHSGGTIISYSFLMTQTKEWRKTNILAYVPVVPVFGGTISSVSSVTTGWARSPMTRCVGRQAAMMVPSVLWMWPRSGESPYQWNRTEVIVQTKTQAYTAYDLTKMLEDMGLQDSVAPLYEAEVKDYLNIFEAPLVDTYALYGYGVQTVSALNFTDYDAFDPSEFGMGLDGNPCPQHEHKSVYHPWDAGDGVGTFRSTSRASQWYKAHKDKDVVLWNKGYKDMRHCEFCTPESKSDWLCIQALLSGKPDPACKLF